MKKAFLTASFGLMAASLVASCGGSLGTVGDMDGETDTTEDTFTDMVTDTDEDPADDTGEDADPDTATDVETDVPLDTPMDSVADTSIDTAIDTAVDTAPDTTPGGGPDCSAPGTAVLGTNYGDSTDTADSYGISGCNDQGGSDETWSFTATDAGIYEFTMQTDGFYAVLMVWATCGSTSEFACLNPDPDSSTAYGSFGLEAGETIYLLADDDTLDGTGGEYTITIEYSPIPAGDDCADTSTAVDGTNDGNTSIFTDDYDGECEGGMSPPYSGPDQVWAYTATCTGTLSVEMDTYPGGGAFNCTLDLWTTCGDTSSSVDCDNDYYSSSDEVCNVSTSVTAGDTLYILCDTNNAGTMGSSYELNIDCT